MGLLFRMSCLAVLVAAAPGPRVDVSSLKTGDVVLQTSTSSRSELIRRASNSPYSHVGLVEVAPDGVYVIEAIHPVSRTPIARFRRRGEGGKLTVLRAKGASAEALSKVVAEAKSHLGTPYDARYRWDDQRLYCSELVAKAFARAAELHVGRFETVKSLRLGPAERALAPKLGIDLEQLLVTPQSLREDAAFEVVASDFARP